MATGTSEGEQLVEDAFGRLQRACDAIMDGATVVPVVRVLVDQTSDLTEVQRQSMGGMCDIVTKAAFDLIRLAKLGDAMRQEVERGG